MGGNSFKALLDPLGFISGGKIHGLVGMIPGLGYEKDTSQMTPEAKAEKEAAAVEKAAIEAEALAEQEAKDAAKKKLAQQTRTVFTSGLGLLGTDSQTKKATLGSGN